MKDGTKNQTGVIFHQMKGTIKEDDGILCDNPKLLTEGRDENRDWENQEKIGEMNKRIKRGE